MNIHEPTFSSQQIATAAGMTSPNFRAYLTRGHWRIIGKAQPAEAAGKGHLFTINDALGYALANRLVQRGVDPKIAFDSAMFDFAHSSGQPGREPGGVFDRSKGATWFIFVPGAPKARVLVTGDKRDVAELVDRATELILIDLTDLRDQVFHSLGFDPRDFEDR